MECHTHNGSNVCVQSTSNGFTHRKQKGMHFHLKIPHFKVRAWRNRENKREREREAVVMRLYKYRVVA